MTDSGGRTALIGHTGFIGSNIASQHAFDDVYNTANIAEIVGRDYDLVVSAAGRADAHRINQVPDEDRAELAHYAELLSGASITKLVHMSTVCVFSASDRCDERTVSEIEALTPYGRNRRWLEETLAERFDSVSFRLPQLFGTGIKKGLVFDLANDYRIEFIRPDGVFQYYDLSRLWADITTAVDAGLPVVNIATEPIEHERLAREVFDIDLSVNVGIEESQFSVMYTRNMITRHAERFGGSGDYIMSADEQMDAIRRFVAREFGSPRSGSVS